jgi:hypothetical protein
MNTQPIVTWIQGTAISRAIVESPWAFPAGETLHFIGLAMLFGFVAALDLRMLGIGKQLPLAPLHRLLPWGVAGFLLTLLTGLLFIFATPQQYFGDWVFWSKMTLILLAGVNVLVFYAGGIYRQVEQLGAGEDAPGLARVIAATSLSLWIGVMFFGRMLPFLGGTF